MAKIELSIPLQASKRIAEQLQGIIDEKVEIVKEEIEKDFKVAAAKAIDVTIAKNKNLFIIPPELHGKLGIGDDGQVNRFKTDRAWELLKITNKEFETPAGKKITTGKQITSFTLKLFKRQTSGNIGKLSLSISNAFYDANRTNIEGTKFRQATGFFEGTDYYIPFMQWYIEGVEIKGWRFFPVIAATQRFSRTGIGLMRKSLGNSFKLEGRPTTWPTLENAIVQTLNSQADKFIRRLLKKLR